MANPRLAAAQKRARRRRATIVLIDQSGFLLSPLVRRTLAPIGETPELIVRGRHRQKVSVIAALSLSPLRSRLGLHFRTLRDGCFQTEHVVRFLRDLLRHFRGPLIVVWDGWKPHERPRNRSARSD